MSATVIPLRHRPRRSIVQGRLAAIETMPAEDGPNTPTDAAQIERVLGDLHAQQDTLLSVIPQPEPAAHTGAAAHLGRQHYPRAAPSAARTGNP